GIAAQAAYANEAAIDYYQRLLPLLPQHEQSAILLRLGEVWQLIGRWDEAETNYGQALAAALQSDNDGAVAACRRAIGVLLRWKGAYPEAHNWLERARSDFETMDDQQGLGETLSEIGVVFWSQGDYTSALEHFERSLQSARSQGDQQGIKKAMNN